MCQSIKKGFIFLILIVCIITGSAACSKQTRSLDQVSGETAPPNSFPETGSTPTSETVESTPTITPTLPEMKMQVFPTFNATLHEDEPVQPHLLAIIGKNNPEINNGSIFSFAADGKSFVVQDNQQLSIWRTSPLKEIHVPSLKTEGIVLKIALSEDNHYATAILIKEHTEKVYLVVWKIMSGQTILDEEIANIEIEQLSARQQSANWNMYEISFVPGTTKIVYKAGKDIFMLDLESGIPASRLNLREDMTAQKISLTRDGRFLYVMLYSQSTDGQPYYQVQIWDTNTLKMRESISLENLTPNVEVDLQAAYILMRDTEQLTLQKMSLENEETEELPYRLGPLSLSSDGYFLIYQHTPDDRFNRQVDIELWSAYNWHKVYTMDNDGEDVNMNYPIDLSAPAEVLLNKDHSLMAICTNGKTYLYDVSKVFH